MTKHLLIVEDQDALSESLARRFSRRGFRVSISSEPADILTRLRAGDVDLCVSDIDLTGPLSGVDVFRQARAEGFTVPFVFLSGHEESSEAMVTARALGAVAVFTKPTAFTELLEQVCATLGMAVDTSSLAANK